MINISDAKIKYNKEWLTKEEVKNLFSNPNVSSRDLLLMKVCYYGAFRISEVLNALKEDFKFEDGYAYLLLREQKTDKENWEKQPIPVDLFGEVKRYCNDKKITDLEHVFQSRQSESLGYDMAYYLVKKNVKESGINKKITTHSFRRSRASHLLDDGMELVHVSKFLRHNSIDTTMKYLKISKKFLFNLMERIDKKEVSKII